MTAGNCYEKVGNTNKLPHKMYRRIAQTKSRHHSSAYEMGTSLSDFSYSRDVDDSMTSSAYERHRAKIDSPKEELTSLPKIRKKLDLRSAKEGDMAEYDGITKRSVSCLASNENGVKLHCFTKQSRVEHRYFSENETG
ncbi:hypothetical protein MLD38_038415 [Melastoma candidum]|uniref:Uncharacterized protein n=1 Tax=Melastoma candidum TaxID=119954 RepID=A0ACB9KYU1_9MYRT|nr:hypothetical protein MLD38_038415 [Melastoma candidum]